MPINRHQIALSIKNAIYGRRGEPYRIDGLDLRYLPGTRPVRMKYRNSENAVNRYDALQVEFFINALAEGDTAIDIGAHCGQYSVLMAAKCGHSGQVIAFEPDPYARQQFLKNVALNPSIKPPVLEATAISDEVGETVLYSCRGNSLSSLAPGSLGPSSVKLEQIAVKIQTLDGYILENKLPTPRCIKIDAEGAEIDILKGAKRVLAGDSRIVCELHPYAWAEFNSTLEELKEIAAESNRSIRYLDQEQAIGNDVEYGTVLLERE